MRLASRQAEESPSVILTPPDYTATKVYLKDTPAGQSSNTEKCMCTLLSLPCHYLNSLTSLPAAIEWTTYGIFTVRAVRCMVLKTNLDNTGCHAQLLYEGGSLSLGKAIEAVAKLLK